MCETYPNVFIRFWTPHKCLIALNSFDIIVKRYRKPIFSLFFPLGDFVKFYYLKEDFRSRECFSTCQLLAKTPSTIKVPPLAHVDMVLSPVADSLHMACYTLSKSKGGTGGRDDSNVDDLITSMCNHLPHNFFVTIDRLVFSLLLVSLMNCVCVNLVRAL